MPRFPHSNYWIQPNNTSRPYAPPICHREYGPILARPVASGFSALFTVSLFNRNTTARATCDAVSIQLENHDDPRLLASTAYRPADADGPIVRDEFALPLVENDDGSLRQEVWRANTRLVFAVSGLTGMEWLRLELIRAGGHADTLLPDMTHGEIMRRTTSGADAMTHDDRHGRLHIVIPLTYGDLVGLDALAPDRAPYKLRLRVRDQEGCETEAWTYFHIPYAQDVATLQRYGDQRIILLADSMQGAANAAGCTLEANADVSDLYLTGEETGAFTRRGTNASKVVQYRKLPVAREELRGMRETLERHRAAEGTTPRDTPAWENLQDNITRAAGQVRAHEKLISRLESEAPELLPPEGIDPSARLYSKHEVNVLALRPSGRCFFGLSWGIIFVARRGAHGWHAHRLYAPGNYRLVRAHDEDWNVEVDSDRTFQAPKWSGGGNDTWHVYDFAADAYPLERAITFGVSACSAGVIFPNVASPDVVIVSHINNYQSCPMARVIDDLTGERALPADVHLRGLYTLFPQHQEMAKYLVPQLFPLALRASARLVLMPRSRHLYGIDESPNYGHESFGLQFEGADAHFVGEYGLERWSNAMAVLWHLLRVQTDACGCGRDPHKASKVKSDFEADVFGPSARLKATKQEIDAFRTFFRGVQLQGAPIRDELDDAVARARRKFKFASLGSALFTAVDAEADTLRATETYLIHHKAIERLHGTAPA